jgi:hypothetical protein
MRCSKKYLDFRIVMSLTLALILLSTAFMIYTPKRALAAPPTPNLTVTAAETGQIILKWTVDSSDLTSFKLERANDNSFINFPVTFNFPASTGTFTDNTIAASTTYYYRIYATTLDGSSPPSEIVSITSPASLSFPQAPIDLLLKTPAANQIILTWKNKSNNEEGFRIERSADRAFTQDLKTFTATAGATSFTDNSTQPLATYFYRVTAYNSAGDSVSSKPASIATPDVAPEAPSNLVVVSTDRQQITLRWIYGSINATGFIIERATDNEFTSNLTGFTVIPESIKDGPAFSATDRQTPAGTFYYRVKAYNASGSSSPSNSVQAVIGDKYDDGNIPFGTNTIPLSYSGYGILGTTIQVDKLGNIFDSQGNIENQSLTLNMDDFRGSIVFPTGTKLLSPNGHALLVLNYHKAEMTPAPPPDKVVLEAFNFGPPGANVDQYVTLNLKYDPSKLPSTTSTNDISVVSWDGAQWQNISGAKIDKANNTVILNMTSFTEVAIITKKPDLSANFFYSNLYVLPQNGKPGDTVYISATVTNKGYSYGYYQASLTINGTQKDIQEGGLDAGASTDIKFICPGYADGKYSFDISGLKGSFTVGSIQTNSPTATSTSEPTATADETLPPESPSMPDNIILYLVLGTVALIALLIIYAFIIRKRD